MWKSRSVHAGVRAVAELGLHELLEGGRVPPVLEVVLGSAPLKVPVRYLDPALADFALALPELHVLGRRRAERTERLWRVKPESARC